MKFLATPLGDMHQSVTDARVCRGHVVLQEDSQTLLHLACSMSGPEAVQIVGLLLDALADPDARMAEDDSYLSQFLVSEFNTHTHTHTHLPSFTGNRNNIDILLYN